MTASIAACTSANYYVQAEQALYYFDADGGGGVWHGAGAAAMGYYGPISPEELQNAFQGLSPDGRVSLVQVQPDQQRQPAWDMTFSAPKDVSTLWSVLAQDDRRRIEELVMKASIRAVDYLESEALLTRRGKRGWLIEHARGVYALFPHGASRALDPQLHVHVLVLNLSKRFDGTTGAIRSRDLYLHKMAAGAIFRLELAHLLQDELRLAVRKHEWSFQLEGVPQALCLEQSKRRQVIERLAREGGWSSPQVIAEIARTSRVAKSTLPLSACFEKWQEEGKRHGFTRAAAERLLSASVQRQAEPRLAADTVQTAISNAVDSLATSKAYFPERDLVCEAATEAMGSGVSATNLLDAVKRQVGAMEYRVNKGCSFYSFYSTADNIAAEKELIQLAERRAEAGNYVVEAEKLNSATKKIASQLSKKLGVPIALTSDQLNALRHITLEPGALKIVQGYAGTGKTQMLKAAYLAWKESGFKVIGTSVTGRAALGLEKATGIPSLTVELLLRKLRPAMSAVELAKLCGSTAALAVREAYYEGIRAGHWVSHPLEQAIRESGEAIAEGLVGTSPRWRHADYGLTPNSILVVDEAGMLSTQALLELLRECDAFQVKLVLVGDRLQLPPIEAGGPFWSLANRVGHCALTTITRQKLAWMREAAGLLINDQPLQALELYAANGALHLSRTQEGAILKLSIDYGKLQSHEFSNAIALTATNEEASRINSSVQSIRKGAGQLGIDSVRLANGQRLFKHDRVMLLQNDYGLDLRNGLLGTVVSVHHTRGIAGPGSIAVKLDDRQGIVTIDLARYESVQLGYAATTHKVQSATVERSFVLLGDTMLSKERAFTQLTRASNESKLYGAEAQYGDSLELLAQQISKKTAKDLALDHVVTNQRQVSYEL